MGEDLFGLLDFGFGIELEGTLYGWNERLPSGTLEMLAGANGRGPSLGPPLIGGCPPGGPNGRAAGLTRGCSPKLGIPTGGILPISGRGSR